jgi:hypothetical protein
MKKEVTGHNIKEKEPYEKPRLEEIELFADEVLSIGCKKAGEPAVLSTCDVGTCFNLGS